MPDKSRILEREMLLSSDSKTINITKVYNGASEEIDVILVQDDEVEERKEKKRGSPVAMARFKFK